MELTTTIKTLEAIKKSLSTINRYETEEAVKNIELMILDFKNELMNSSNNKTTTKQRDNKIKSWFNKMLKACRPALAYSTKINDYQCLTDSYFMVALDESNHCNIADVSTTKYNYPNLQPIFNNMIKSLNNNKDLQLDINYILNALKLNDYVFIINHESFNGIDKTTTFIINKESFKNMLTFLNVSKNDDIKKATLCNDILNIETTTGSYGVLCGMRKNDEIMKKSNHDNTIHYGIKW